MSYQVQQLLITFVFDLCQNDVFTQDNPVGYLHQQNVNR